MPDQDTPDTVGSRIARARGKRGLTQHGLAALTNYSRGLIAQVEAGHKPPTAPFIAAVAAAVRVDPARLWGQPFQDDDKPDHAVYAPIPEIRRALTITDVAPDLDGPARTLDALAVELATAHRLRHASQHARLGARLPALLEELTWHAYETEEARAWKMLHSTYSVTASLTRRLGFTDLASMVQERSAVSALRSGEQNLAVMVAYRRALLMANANAPRPAVRLLERSLSQVEADRPDAVEATGSLHLRAAVVAARAGDGNTAWDHFHQADEVSERAGRPVSDVHLTEYCPGNLLIHGAALAVELGDYDEATRRDQNIRPRDLGDLSPERRAHHGLDMARVRLETGDRDQALARLLGAEKIAPQMVRYHPAARTTTRHLAGAWRTMPERLRGLLSRMGL